MSQITYMNYAKDGQHASFQNTTTTTTQWYTSAMSKPAASSQLLRKGSGKGSVRKIAKNRDPFTPMSNNVSPATSISRSSSASSTNTKTFASNGAAAKSAAARKPPAAPKVNRPQVIAEAPLSTPKEGQPAAAAANEHEDADEPPLFVRKIRASERRNGSIRRRSLRLDIPQPDRKESWFKNIPHISSSISSSFRRQVSKSRPLPIEFLDHSCLTSFSEILPGTASPSVGSPSEEIDELDSEHVAYSLAFVDDYIEPPVGFSVTQETVDVLSPLETSQRCQSCNGKFSGTVLELCECCQTVLCKECFGPLVFSFQFPRVDKATGKRIQTPDPNRQQRIKELCQRCMKCCAGPKKRNYCRLKEFGQHYITAGASADPTAADHQAISRVAVDRTPASLARRHRTSTGSRYSMHHRQLTQLSIQIAGVHAAGGGGPGWTAKMAAFFYKVTTSFTIWSQPLRINGFFSWAEDSKRSRIASPELEDEEQ